LLLQVSDFAVKSVDIYQNNTLFGLANGDLKVMAFEEGNKFAEESRSIMKSHNEGEVWGLAQLPDEPHKIVSSGDDGQYLIWDTEKKENVERVVIAPGTKGKAATGGASSMSKKPASQ